MKTYRKHLAQKLEDGSFAKEFHAEREKLRIAYDIHAARIKSGLTQKQLAEKAGLTQQMVSRIENANVPNMAYNTVRRIADALDMDVGLVAR